MISNKKKKYNFVYIRDCVCMYVSHFISIILISFLFKSTLWAHWSLEDCKSLYGNFNKENCDSFFFYRNEKKNGLFLQRQFALKRIKAKAKKKGKNVKWEIFQILLTALRTFYLNMYEMCSECKIAITSWLFFAPKSVLCMPFANNKYWNFILIRKRIRQMK